MSVRQFDDFNRISPKIQQQTTNILSKLNAPFLDRLSINNSNNLDEGSFLIEVDSSNEAIVLSLPFASEFDGKELVVTDVGGFASSNRITLMSQDGDLINLDQSVSINQDYGTVVLYANGEKKLWHIISGRDSISTPTIGSVSTSFHSASFFWNSSIINLKSLIPGDKINQVAIVVDIPFDLPSTIIVGFPANPSEIFSAGDSDLTKANTYEVFPFRVSSVSEDFNAIVSGSATVGQGRIFWME